MTRQCHHKGFTLIELMIGLTILGVVVLISVTQLQNIANFFAGSNAELSAKAELVQAADLVRSYFKTKWKGGQFECSTTPTIGTHSYCVVNSDCASTAGVTYNRCRSVGIIRGDPADATTNPNRVRLLSRCITASAQTQKNLKFGKSVCNLDCPVGQFPATTLEITMPNGTSNSISFPGGSGSGGREITSTSEVRGLEACISKPSANGVITLDLQAYYLQDGILQRLQKQVSFPEQTSLNTAIEFLP